MKGARMRAAPTPLPPQSREALVHIEVQRSAPLSAQELYLFDTMAVLRIPGFLSPDAVEQCRAEVLRLPSRVMAGRGDKERFDDLVMRSPHFDEFARSNEIRQCV